ncbi:MAG: glycosyltransferase family 4 protein [bacterium]
MSKKKKIRVAFVLSGLGYISRGTEVAFTNYMSELVKKDDIEIIAFGAGKNFHINGVTYVRVPCLMRHSFKNFPKIKRLYIGRSDAYEEVLFALLVAPIMFFYHIDVVVHSSFPFNLWPIMLYRWFRNKGLKTVFNSGGGTGFFYSRHFFADAVTVTDPFTQAQISTKYNTILIPPGADAIFSKPRPDAREKLELPKDKLVIFSSSAFDPNKRIEFLIRAASKIKNVLLLLSSTGKQREYLEQLGKKLLGENIRFLGVVDQETLASYYAAADVFCLPSKNEPFGLVLIEAMASGTPVVTNNSDVQKWIVAEGGSCINVEDEATLIVTLESYRNSMHREKVGALARINAERFSWSTAADQYQQLFHKLVGY